MKLPNKRLPRYYLIFQWLNVSCSNRQKTSTKLYFLSIFIGNWSRDSYLYTVYPWHPVKVPVLFIKEEGPMFHHGILLTLHLSLPKQKSLFSLCWYRDYSLSWKSSRRWWATPVKDAMLTLEVEWNPIRKEKKVGNGDNGLWLKWLSCWF